MVFQIGLVEESDLDELARIDAVAMADNGPARAIEKAIPGGGPRSEVFLMWMRKTFRQDDTHAFWKIVDTDTGEIVSAAKWSYYYEPEAPEVDAKQTEEAKNELPSPMQPVIDVTIALWRNWQAFRKEHVEGKRYANLDIIMTSPKYQRQGAGSMLMRQGLGRADEAGLDCFLYASVQGRRLYEKFGFETVQTDSIDLTEYGVDHVAVRASMRRKAPAPKS